MKSKITFTLIFTMFFISSFSQCWKSVSTCDAHTLAIKDNGTLWAWGRNNLGQIGDGTFINRLTPVQIGIDSNWKTTDCGGAFSAAIKSDGSLWTWGYNGMGCLGNGTNVDENIPTRIDSSYDWTEISTKGMYVLALKNDSSLWAWGNNSSCQLGIGIPNNKNSPQLVDSFSKWIAIDAGQFHSLGIKKNGTLWSWGENNKGELGLGTSLGNQCSPTQVGLDSSWAKISTGRAHSIVKRNDNSLWACGYNIYGQLGNGGITDISTLSRIDSNISWNYFIASGHSNTGLKNNGTIWSWGPGVPLQIGIENNWEIISQGSFHRIALKNDGSIWGWGSNDYGQLGLNDTISRINPVQIITTNCVPSKTNEYNFTPYSIYPNPTRGFIKIATPNKIDYYQIDLFDFTGKALQQYTIKGDIELNLNKYNSGIYILRITDKQTTKLTKILIE